MKKIELRKVDWFVLLLGIVFLSAATYRIFNYSAGLNEIIQLNLPSLFLPFVILLEIVVGILFLSNKKIVLASALAIVFLGTAISLAIIQNFSSIISTLSELFVFDINPTDIWLHIIYVAILFAILIKYIKK